MPRPDRKKRGSVALMLVGIGVGVFIASGCAMPAMGGHGSSMHGGGTDSTSAPEVVGTEDQVIEIRDSKFVPGNVVVPIGSTVRWVNRDEAPHDATAVDGSWRTDLLRRSESGAVELTAAAEFEYYCSVHPGMRARLVVR